MSTLTLAAHRILEPQLLHHHGSRSGRSDLQNGWAKDGHYVCVCVVQDSIHCRAQKPEPLSLPSCTP